MLLLPIISILLIYMISLVIKNKKILISSTLCLSIILSIYGITNYKPTYLYEDNKYVLELANKYQDDDFVYVYDNYFTHLSSMEEFATYKNSIILNINDSNNDFNILNGEELNSKDEFILCIKGWINQEEALEKVLSGSGYTNYEVLLSLNSDVEATYYKVTK